MSELVNRLNKANALYGRGEKCWADGKLRSAFRLFLAAAKAGFVPAFEIIGYFYGSGIGTKPDRSASLFWYMRAYRRETSWYRGGLSTSANNIGCIWRNRKQFKTAIVWFERAAELGDGDANLNIAEIYLRNKHDHAKAIHYLQKTIKAPYVTDGSIEEARKLLSEVRKTKPTVSRSTAKMDRSSAKRGAKRQPVARN